MHLINSHNSPFFFFGLVNSRSCDPLELSQGWGKEEQETRERHWMCRNCSQARGAQGRERCTNTKQAETLLSFVLTHYGSRKMAGWKRETTKPPLF